MVGICRVYLGWVYARYTMVGTPSLPGYTMPSTMLSHRHVPLSIIATAVRQSVRSRGAQSGNNPWVREEESPKGVIPVKVSRKVCAELFALSRA